MVTAWVYKTKRAMRKKMSNPEIEGCCFRESSGDCHIFVTDKGLEAQDGTAIHEAVHVMHYSKAKDHEIQADLVEQVTKWLMGMKNKK
jgi:hypothetical protein